MRTMHVNLCHTAKVFVVVLYCFHLEVVDTLSNEADFVILNFVNKISFHIVFVLVGILFFN